MAGTSAGEANSWTLAWLSRALMVKVSARLAKAGGAYAGRVARVALVFRTAANIVSLAFIAGSATEIGNFCRPDLANRAQRTSRPSAEIL